MSQHLLYRYYFYDVLCSCNPTPSRFLFHTLWQVLAHHSQSPTLLALTPPFSPLGSDPPYGATGSLGRQMLRLRLLVVLRRSPLSHIFYASIMMWWIPSSFPFLSSAPFSFPFSTPFVSASALVSVTFLVPASLRYCPRFRSYPRPRSFLSVPA